LSNQEHLDEDNDRAKDLEEKAKRIDLGKNLEQRADKKAPKQKDAKEKKPASGRPQADDGFEASGAVIGQHEQGESVDAAISSAAVVDEEEPSGKREKKKKRDKRGKKDKEGKKDKKRHKKSRKRGLDEEESADEGVVEEGSPEGSDKDGDGFDKVADEDEDVPSDTKLKKHKKDKKKHDKKQKKDKKDKRMRRHGKHDFEDSDDEAADAEDAAMEEDLFGQGLDENNDAAMEEELFGPDTDA